jgi:3-oxoacyl-[acyl-carrier-protein] synthase II
MTPAGRGSWPATPRRVVVTGTGMLTALGNDVATTWDGLVAGRSGIATITAFDPSRLAARIAGEVKDLDASHILDRKEVRRTDRYIQFGLVASRQAMDQAGLPARLEGDEAQRTGVILGTGLGGVGTLVDGISINALRGPDRISPFLIPMGIPNVGAGQVAISFGMTGPNFTTVSACATGGHAIGEAFETIRRGDADTMIAGGSEAGVYEPLIGGFDSMRALSRRNDDPEAASRPFDKARDGFVCGEGAGVLVLEELGHAQARGAAILAELIGYGATADASHITLPAPGGIGAVRAAQRALDKAGIGPDDVDHVNAHATSTPEGDKAELQAIRTIFGDRAGEIPVTANKSMIGHTLGAAGAIEAIVTILSIRESCVPPTINLDDPDDTAVGLDLTPNRAKSHDIRTALSNSFGFGGQNTALVFRRWTE